MLNLFKKKEKVEEHTFLLSDNIYIIIDKLKRAGNTPKMLSPYLVAHCLEQLLKEYDRRSLKNN